MDLMPILSTLRRHKTAASLIVIEIALTSAIVCNALHLISTRLAVLNNNTGVAEAELVVMGVRGTVQGSNAEELTAQDLAALRAVPGVKSVAVLNQVVYGQNSSNSGIRLNPQATSDRVSAANYYVGEDALATLGLKLVEGRDFKPEEYVSGAAFDRQERPSLGQVIINQALANKLWPGETAVGKTVYALGDAPTTVVGVVDQLPHPYPARRADERPYSMMFPVRPTFRGATYLLRTDPAQRDPVIRAATAALEPIDPTRIVSEGRTLSEMRSRYYAQDRAMVWLMGGVIVALMVVTAFGIVGLASFWVQQRTRMIGTRRALGATRAQIRGYFQLENFMLTSAGIVLGLAGALGLSLWLMRLYEMPRLPLVWLPVAALALWALGQLAVLAPARRAAALPPVQALRS
ncbi:ABC transporter permease [Pseudorhodoferax sp.]|uniref:ABC transporter permease n=1 Tax=Pseudorhodoferax sp. TaxID=1993553 RepID=UPI002DD6791B|nr:FtsX-like permease family protein [Pseudorhodoferax sp.]